MCYDLLSLPLGRYVLNHGWHKGGEKSLNGIGGVIGSKGLTGVGMAEVIGGMLEGDVIGGMVGLTGVGKAGLTGGIVADVVGSGG